MDLQQAINTAEYWQKAHERIEKELEVAINANLKLEKEQKDNLKLFDDVVANERSLMVENTQLKEAHKKLKNELRRCYLFGFILAVTNLITLLWI